MAKLKRPWGPFAAVTLPGAAVALLGLVVLSGYLTGQAQWRMPIPHATTMSASVALGLLLAGIGVLAAAGRVPVARAVRLAAGTLVALLGAAGIEQQVIGFDLGIDLSDLHRAWEPEALNPGRMSPLTGPALFIAGVLLLAIDRPKGRFGAISVQLLAGVLLAIGIVSLVAYDSSPEGIYPWSRDSRMAPTTAAGVTALGVAFLALIASSPWYERVYAGRADERILVLALGILSLVLVGTGAAAISILQRHLERSLSSAMLDAVDTRATILESGLANRAVRATILANRPSLEALLAQWEGEGSPALRVRMQEEAASYLGSGFRGVLYYDRLGRAVAEAGTFGEPQLETRILAQNVDSTLVWDGQTFLLRVFAPVHHRGAWVGSVLSEQEMELLPRLHFDVEELGRSVEWVMCSNRGEAMACFPQRFVPYPRVQSRRRGGEALPIDPAMDGKRGFATTTDYRGVRVMAAYAPAGATGLSVAIKIDVQEFYEPLRDSLAQWARWLVAMALLGALLVASQVRPIAQRLMQSENLARGRAEALARSEAEMRALFTSVTDGIMVFTPEGVIEFLNPAAARIFGYAEGELIGKHVGILIPEGLREANLRATGQFLETGDSGLVGRAGVVYPALRRDGKRFDIEFSLGRMQGDAGTRLVGIVRDVSERTALERAKSEFLASVSHELRTPLTSIIGSLELAAESDIPEPGRGFVDMARRNSQRLGALVNDVIDAARLDSGVLRFEPERFGAAAFAAEAVALNQAYAGLAGVSLRLEPAEADAELEADRGRLMQVMANLLSNAAKFSPEGSQVRVRVSLPGESVRFEVIDRGRGIPDEFRAHVFERFAQADASDSREHGGAGLGLAIARAFVERMGGTIGFDSRVGEGTTFWFEMPRAAAPAQGTRDS